MNFRVFKKRLTKLSDEELALRYREKQDSDCLGELYDRYRALMYGIALKYLEDREKSRDAVMDIVESLTVKLAENQVSNFSSWLHSVVKNHCLMLLRKEKRAHTVEFNPDYMELITELHPTNERIDQRLVLLQSALGSLSSEQKTCIELFYLSRKSYREVSTMTGFEVKKVKSHIQNGKRNLKLFIEKHEE